MNSKELYERAQYVEQQEELAEQALISLGEMRKYYSAQYSLGLGSKSEGEFVGLCCKSCRKWIEFGHDKECAVPDVEMLLKKIGENK